MMIGFLCVERDAGKEAECFAEILEREASDQRLAALLESPAIWSVHGSLVALEMPFTQAQLGREGES